MALSRRSLLSAALCAAPQVRLTKQQDDFLDDLSRRSFRFFWEQADPRTGLVRDRALADAGEPDARPWTSSAATGFGLSALCIAAERGWITKQQARQRTVAVLRFYADESFQMHGWFYHFRRALEQERGIEYRHRLALSGHADGEAVLPQ